MKTSIWDILSIFLLLGIILVGAVVLVIYNNPNVAFNPYPPSKFPSPLFIPTATITPARMPPTWTPTTRPTLAATVTPRASATPFSTSTPFILPSPTTSALIAMATNTRMPLIGKCKVVTQVPEDETEFKPGTPFVTRWTLQNTGDKVWDMQNIDVRFLGGDRLHIGKDLLDITKSIKPGETATLTVDMTAPEKTGYYITYWSFQSSGQPVCSFYVEIFVQ